MNKQLRSTLVVLTAWITFPLMAQETTERFSWPTPAYERDGATNQLEVPVLDGQATLQDYLTYAALNNPGLEAAFNRWKAALEKITQAETLPDPKFTFAYFIEEVETRVGPQESKVGLMQMFPWFGTLSLRGDVASESANAAFEQYQAAKLNLFFQVKKAYYEYYFLYRAISITDDNIQLLKHLESVAQSKHKAGASQSGVIKAQVELGKLDDRLRTLRDLRRPMAARLNAALNRPYNVPLPWPHQAPLDGATIVADEMFAQFVDANPELKSLDSLVRKEEQSIALARKEFFPSFSLGVDYVSTGEALMAEATDSGKDPVVAMIALDIPIWRGKYKAGVEEARHRHQAAELARNNTSNVLAADLQMVLYRFHDAERKIDLYGDTLVPQSIQALEVAEEAYRAGTADFLNLIDAERLLLEFQLAHQRSLADREIALAEVEKLVGKPLGKHATK